MIHKDGTSNLDQLRQSETRYRRLFESAQDGILIVDARDGQVLDANPFIAELLGFSPAELSGRKLWELGLFRDTTAIKSVFATLQDSGYARHEDLPLKSKDGRQVDVEFVSNRYREGDAEVIQCNIRDISRRKLLQDQLRQAADTDELTGLANRRHILELAQNELQRARRYRRSLSVLMLDIDNFKRINDTYGHAVGDRALRAFADSCRIIIRNADLIGRLGGEEFIVLMPETPQQAAVEAADRLRIAVAAVKLLPECDRCPPVTASIGVATTADGAEHLDCLLQRADRQLYRAKDAGRNCVCADEIAAAVPPQAVEPVASKL
ncbi:MAG: sensor domain-containing diguanylate cyclase [Sinimarinibacterium sp.]